MLFLCYSLFHSHCQSVPHHEALSATKFIKRSCCCRPFDSLLITVIDVITHYFFSTTIHSFISCPSSSHFEGYVQVLIHSSKGPRVSSSSGSFPQLLVLQNALLQPYCRIVWYIHSIACNLYLIV